MISCIHIEYQLGFPGAETICDKQYSEKSVLEHDIYVENYLAYNGLFKARFFNQHFRDRNQRL